jgi:hypothetical protein
MKSPLAGASDVLVLTAVETTIDAGWRALMSQTNTKV